MLSTVGLSSTLDCSLYAQPQNGPNLPRSYPLFPADTAFSHFSPEKQRSHSSTCSLHAFQQAIVHHRFDTLRDSVLLAHQSPTLSQQLKAMRAPFEIHQDALWKGSVGSVFPGQWFPHPSEEQGLPVAIKAISKKVRGSRIRTLTREVKGALIMYRLAPDAGVRLLDVYLDHPTHWFLIMERGIMSLEDYIRKVTQPPYMTLQGDDEPKVHILSESILRDAMVRVILGLDQLYRAGSVHGDIKPANLILFHTKDNSLTIKLADFGLFRSSQDPDFHHYYQGTPAFKPHGFKLGTPLTHKHFMTVDTYALILTIHYALYAPRDDPLFSLSEHPNHPTISVSSFPHRAISPSLQRIFQTILVYEAWLNHPTSLRDMMTLLREWMAESLSG